ncbi:MAG: formate dehydrogenase subunit alpha [Candidatus Heimdallarchaeota archaeon]|nr:formate dehydrogenase subunit alpha [Candidatus Heimdallarchaeota archaeon]
MRTTEIKRKGELITVQMPDNTRNEFYQLNYEACIRCGKCVKAVEDIQVCNVMTIDRQGDIPYPIPTKGETFEDAGCVACGTCVNVCPVDALIPNSKEPYLGKEFEEKRVKTICAYCGVGCNLEMVVNKDENRIMYIDTKGTRKNPVNQDHTCVKGKFGFDYVHSPDRLNTPLIRDEEGHLVEATWEEAFDAVEKGLRGVYEKYGSDTMAFLTSAKCTNEENYLIQKFTRAVFKTNNIDHCARLCHASTVTGLIKTMGSGANTQTIKDLTEDAEVIFIIGSNTSASHPVIAGKIRQSVKKGTTKLIVADPRTIGMSEHAEIKIRHLPGSDLALLNAMIKVIVEEELVDYKFINERTEGFYELRDWIKTQDFDLMVKLTGEDPEKIRAAARLFANAKTAAIVYAMGITQHFTGTYNVTALASLVMMTGNVGKPGVGMNPLRGQNNVQGACDMGGLPNVYPGYQNVNVPEHKAKFEKFWGVEGLPLKVGRTVTEITQGAAGHEIEALYVIGENPALSDPNMAKALDALNNLDFLVVQDIFMTETAKYAHVVLPATSWAEKCGTFVNTERRVQRVRQAIEPEGDRKADWEIINELLIRFGFPKRYESPAEIMDEIRECTPIYGGITYERIDEVGLQWPCPTIDHPGTPILHVGEFTKGKGTFVYSEYLPPGESPGGEYPFILTTGRSLYHFHTGTMSRRSKGLDERRPIERTQINPVDAEPLGIKDGDRLRISSRRGSLETVARVTDKIVPGVIFMTFHFRESAANLLTSEVLDPFAKIPELKVAAVKVEKIH